MGETDDHLGGLLSLFSVKDVSTSHSFTQSSSGIAKEISDPKTIFGLLALFITIMIMIGCNCLYYRYQRKKAEDQAEVDKVLKNFRSSQGYSKRNLQRSSQRSSQRISLRNSQQNSLRNSQRSSQRSSGRSSQRSSGRSSGRGSALGFET